SLLLRCSCKLVNNPWKDNINLCSILDMHRPTAKWSPLPEKTKIVKVPDQVKSAIVAKLRSSKGSLQLTKACTASLHLQGSDSQLLWEDVTATTDVLLVCHIATTILEVKYPNPSTTASSSSDSSNRVVATHLSGYCAYLVACCPELLPDDDGWSKDLYKAVKADARRALAAGRAPPEYEKLVRLLSAGCRHKVLRNGAQLAEQLVALVQNQQEEEEEGNKAWGVLAEFWSEIILYLAPSDNLDAHAAASSSRCSGRCSTTPASSPGPPPPPPTTRLRLLHLLFKFI
ncbi:Os07g0132700, partial [Oryza sativa Japonica Group]